MSRKNIFTFIKIFFALAFVVVGMSYFYRTPTPTVINDASVDDRKIAGDVSDFVSFSIAPGAKLTSSSTVVTGSIKGGYFFEGNARGLLLNINKNKVSEFLLKATSEWMTDGPVSFTATMDSTNAPSGDLGFIRLLNDNPSGDMTRVKYIDIPISFQ